MEYNKRITDQYDTEVESFARCPRFDRHELTEAQIQAIAQRAAEKAVVIARDNFYKDVGKTVISKWLIMIGMMTVGGYAWMKSKGLI